MTTQVLNKRKEHIELEKESLKLIERRLDYLDRIEKGLSEEDDAIALWGRLAIKKIRTIEDVTLRENLMADIIVQIGQAVVGQWKPKKVFFDVEERDTSNKLVNITESATGRKFIYVPEDNTMSFDVNLGNRDFLSCQPQQISMQQQVPQQQNMTQQQLAPQQMQQQTQAQQQPQQPQQSQILNKSQQQMYAQQTTYNTQGNTRRLSFPSECQPPVQFSRNEMSYF